MDGEQHMGISRNNLVCEEESAAEGLVRDISSGIRIRNPKERGGIYNTRPQKKKK
jgi:hypothetical protein